MKCGIVGIGHLGKALIKQLEKSNIQTYAYHPSKQKAKKIESKLKKVKAIDFEGLFNVDVILLALPAEAVQEFLKEAEKEIYNKNLVFVNMSSIIKTEELKNEFPTLTIFGVKMLGHADYLYEHGNGIFITRTPLETKKFQEVKYLFTEVGKLYEDDESIVSELNGMAVKHIIQSCVNFENEAKLYPDIFKYKAMDTIFPNTLKLYRSSSFDGFMLKIMEEMKK